MTKETKKAYMKKWHKRNKQHAKEYQKEYYQVNKEHLKKTQRNRYKNNKKKALSYAKKYRKEHKKTIKKYRINHPEIKSKYRNLHPWSISYDGAEQRCNNPNRDSYKNYGGKGIKFFMTIEDFKYLWFRDKAYLMDKPSIDRKDSNGHYELSNCRFIEMPENNSRKRFGERK